MSTPEIIPWPREFRRGETVNEWKAAAYERQRAEAAISRLKVAIEALEVVRDWSPHKSFGEREADKALASIGELKGEI